MNVVRGGSWNLRRGSARCASRSWDLPGGRFDSTSGFGWCCFLPCFFALISVAPTSETLITRILRGRGKNFPDRAKRAIFCATICWPAGHKPARRSGGGGAGGSGKFFARPMLERSEIPIYWPKSTGRGWTWILPAAKRSKRCTEICWNKKAKLSSESKRFWKINLYPLTLASSRLFSKSPIDNHRSFGGNFFFGAKGADGDPFFDDRVGHGEVRVILVAIDGVEALGDGPGQA